MRQPTTARPAVNAIAKCPGLRLRERHGAPSGNALVQGDNLLVMQELLAGFEGQVDLIYIDPPFDVGADFKMEYPLSPGAGELPSKVEVTAYRDRWGEGAESYLNQMKQRLELMYRLLSERGALWVHCDYRVNHQLRLILDEIFGQPCVNEIVWAYGAGGNPVYSFPRKHDYLLVYARSGQIRVNKHEAIMRVPYDQSTLTTHYRSVDRDGRQYRSQKKNGKEYLTFADEGKLVTDVWTDIGAQNATSPISQESTGFASQKPEKLLERIIAGTTGPDYLVADFFCGSGTTGAVASRLGRRWLMADFGDQAIHTTRKRLLHQEPTVDFSILDLGLTEPEQWWAKNRLRPRLSYEETILSAFGADPETHLARAFVCGKEQVVCCHVAPIDTTVCQSYLDNVLPRLQTTPAMPICVFAWDFCPELREAAALSTLPKTLSLLPIPRSLMEVGQPSPSLWQALPGLRVSLTPESPDNHQSTMIAIEHYCPHIRKMSSGNAESIVLASEQDGRPFVDLLAADCTSDPDQPFHYDQYAVSNRRDRKGFTNHSIAIPRTPQSGYARIRVVDIFGTVTTIRVRTDGGI